jgi:uncharacterized protein YndB with AHSA1/START domain
MTVVSDAGATVLRKSIVVPAPIERAFDVFTGELASWWPLKTHSVGAERAQSVILEGRVGGRLYERIAGGEESDWGTVTAWEPPRRVAFTWHPGRDAGTAQEVEIRLTPEEAGTRLELEHRGWEKLAERAAEVVARYDGGWDRVLECYADAAGPPT